MAPVIIFAWVTLAFGELRLFSQLSHIFRSHIRKFTNRESYLADNSDADALSITHLELEDIDRLLQYEPEIQFQDGEYIASCIK
ncbi:hypothetical protein ACH5RR_008737, partial [Cinchona calisaya]